MAAIVDVLNTALTLSGESDYVGGLLRAAGGHRAFDAAVEGSNRRLALFGAGAGVVAGGLAVGIGRAVMAAGRMEQVEIGFKGILGSAEAARAKIEELQEFAARTPFNFSDLARGSQLLMGAGTSAEQVIPILQALGNGMSLAGKGTEDFNGALVQISQIINAGKLQGDELRILQERGLPLKEVLDELGTSMGNVGKAGITSERFIAALIKVMSQGKFAGAMEAQSKTLIGSFSNLQDASERLLITIGKPLINPFVQVTKGITDLTNLLNSDSLKPVMEIVGPGALLGVVALGVASVVSAFKLRALNKENAELFNKSLKAGSGADTQRSAEDLLAGAMGRAGKAASLLTGWLGGLEKAHIAAALAADRQYLAESRLGGVGVGGRGVPAVLPGGTAAGGAGGRGVPTVLPGGTATRTGAGGVPVPTILPRTAQAGINAAALAAEHAKMSAANIRTAPFDTGALAAGHAARRAAQIAAEKTMMGDTAALFAGGAAAGQKAGLLGKAAGAVGKLGRFGTVGGIVAEVAGHLALSQLPDEGAAGGFKRIGQGALTGAGIGGMIGNMIVPGAGGLVGAAGGALVGGGLAAVGEQKAKAEETDTKKLLAAAEKQNELTAKLLEAVDRQGKFPVSTDFVPGSMQIPILRALGKTL